ncbi:uncharacterized protein LOC110830988 isoform X2 [Zootermopsis nevadensis]|uniref:uncharacterized protein LOC110830988 isoform X2 n=1 Tax=Zootermopsis nevadensis TaxID=136037 RepID=UPI000B8ED0EB|nr:uncharacterized protein LOC110830988 isoform X2 [Zootermopsis nevadensis]
MNTEQVVQDYRNKGNACFKAKRMLDAVLFYKKALELDAKNPYINSNLAQAYLEERDFGRAEYHAMKAISANRDSPKGYFRAAKASVGLHNKDKAIKYLKKGIEVCNNSDTEDLRTYLKTLCEEHPSGTRVASQSLQEDFTMVNDVPSQSSDSDSAEYIQTGKLGSQSISRMSAATFSDINKASFIKQHNASLFQTSSDDVNIEANKKPKKKKKKGTNVEGNPFMARLESIKKELDIKEVTSEQFWKMQRNEFQSLLKEGSEVMASGLPRKAVEKYKTALDMILDHSVEDFRIKEIDVIVLKYSLCVGWIDLANYEDIVKAVEYLNDIEEKRSSKFPAVFYGLGSAYYKLNRYKAAVEHLEKGLLFLKREVKFEVHPWPGTNNIIQETTRSFLQEVLTELLKTCRAYHEPDAICRYSQCLTLSSHIIPSEHIFYSDPDFSGFVVIICQEKCRIEYHLTCWKEYKEAVLSNKIGKLSDKDFIGRCCPTTDCVTQGNKRSVITKIEIVGDDTTIKTSIEAPKTETAIKDLKKMKKKKGEKSAEITVQDKAKIKRPQKIKKIISYTIQVASQETQAANSAEELATQLENLQLLRDSNFGCTDNNWNLKENSYDSENIQHLDHFLSPEEEPLQPKKEFVFSYFYELLRNEGPQKIKVIEQKWQNESGEFEGINDIVTSHASICSFLLQSYRFVSIDDYICLAEQKAAVYNMVKTELVESLFFTLTGLSNYTESLTDMSQQNSNAEVEPPSHTSSNMDLSTHSLDSKSAVETVLSTFVDEPSASTNSAEAFIPHAEVVDDVEDPDICTVEGNVFGTDKRHLTSVSESVISEGEKVDSFISDNSCDDSDKIDSRSDEVADDGGAQWEENIVRNAEEEDGKLKEAEENKGVEENVDKKLNVDASEFICPAKIVPEQEELAFYPEGDDGPEITERSVSVSDERTEFLGTASGYNASGTKDLAVHVSSASSRRTYFPAVVQHPVPYYQTLCSSPFPSLQLPWHVHHFSYGYLGMVPVPVTFRPSPYPLPFSHRPLIVQPKVCSIQKMELSDTSAQTLRDEISTLESTVKKPEKELKDEKILESKLEQQNQKIKKLELELAKVLEEKKTDFGILIKELIKKEEECEALKTRFEEEKKERQITENNTMTIMRNLISETGQKVKELEEELTLTKRDLAQYQHLVLIAKKEAGVLQISFLKKKCLDTLQAMRLQVKYLTESSTPNKTEVTTAIKNWEQYFDNVADHEVQFTVNCTELNEKVGKITVADFVKLDWTDLPQEPSCPVDTLEVIIQKALEEQQDLKGKLIAQDKELAQMKLERQKAVDDLAFVEQQALKLRKVIKNRSEVIENTLMNKDTALPPSETMLKMSEVDKKEDSSDSKIEEKFKQILETLVRSDEKNFEQNGCSRVHVPSSPVTCATGVPLLQHSTPVYGYQPMLHSQSYFYNTPQTAYPLPMAMQYGQQQGPPVISSGPALWPPAPRVPQASIGTDKASVQQQPEAKLAPSLSRTEIPNSAASATIAADKLHLPSESKVVPVEKKLPSSAFGLTPVANTMPPSTSAFGTDQLKDTPSVASFFKISPSTAEVPKQELHQMSKPAETPKPLLQTSLNISTASPLEPRPNITSALKPKTKSSSHKLMDKLLKNFPDKTEDELSSYVKIVRERSNNSLTGFTLPKIIDMVDKVRKEKESKKQGSMGLDKFGGTAWSGVHNSASVWSKSNESLEEECSICMESMDKDQTSLHCKHSFHTKCITRWLQKGGVCPLCRTVDEYPPLS